MVVGGFRFGRGAIGLGDDPFCQSRAGKAMNPPQPEDVTLYFSRTERAAPEKGGSR